MNIIYEGLSHGNQLFMKEWEKEGFIERISVFIQRMKDIIKSHNSIIDNSNHACITANRINYYHVITHRNNR